jgi:beta propeller repeat protein
VSCWNPAISSDLIVWEENTFNQDVWAAAVGGGTAFPVAQAANTQQTPAVSGSTVVWADDRASIGVYKIYGATVNPATGAVSEFVIDTTAGVKSAPDISGRYVVYVNKPTGGNEDIYLYDLITSDITPICTNTAKQINPAISGNLIVWQDYRNNATYPDIYGYRIGSGEFAIRAQTASPMYLDSMPAVSGDTVAWVDGRSAPGNARIYAATVSGTSVTAEWEVSSTPTRSVSTPSVNGTLVAWTYSGGATNEDIYGYRIGAGAGEFPIVSTAQYEYQAAVGPTLTAFTNHSAWDIYAAGIGGLSFTGSVTADGGAAYTTDRQVNLTLVAASSAAAVSQMRLSSDGIAWSAWQGYSTSATLELPAGDGAKTVYAQFKDAAGNESAAVSDGITLDGTKPWTGDNIPVGWSAGDVTVTLTPDDGSGSGVAQTVYRADGSEDAVYTAPFTVSGNGVHPVRFSTTDVAGNWETPVTKDVKIDTLAPVTSDDTDASWHKSETVTLTPDDGSGSGGAHTYFKLDGAAEWTEGTSVTVDDEGEHALSYYSVDEVGNEEAARSAANSVKIDTTAPTTTATDPGSAWQAGSVTVTLTAVDAGGSGLRRLYYKADDGPLLFTTNATVDVEFSTSGDHTLTYYSNDQAGNSENSHLMHVRIDKTAPVTTDNTTSDWRSGAVTVQLTADDGGMSGVAHTYYKLDGAAEWTEGTSVLVEGQGEHTLTYYSVDAAGCAEEARAATNSIKIDASVPSTTDDAPAGWQNGPVQLHLETNEAGGAGLAHLYYSIDGGAQGEYSGEIYVNGDGDHIVRYYAVDAAGNSEPEKSVHVKIDTVGPWTEASGDLGGWYKDSATVNLTAADNLGAAQSSGPGVTEYSLDGGGTWTEGSSFTISNEGTHWVKVRSRDAVGNQSTAEDVIVKVDSSGPWVTATGFDGGWSREPVSLRFDGWDEGAGTAAYYSSVDGGGSWQEGGERTISAEGGTTVEYYAVDTLGNEGAHETGTVMVDGQAPATSAAGADDAWHAEPVVVSFSADPGAGSPIVYTEYSVDGGATWPDGPSVEVSQQGVTTVYFRSHDAAGNAEESKSVEVKIDRVAPATTAAGASLTWKRTPISVIFTATETDSGLSYTEHSRDGGATWVQGSGVLVAEQGDNEILYRSSDLAGNVEEINVCRARYDFAKPGTKAAYAATVYCGKYATLKYRVDDNVSPQATVTIRIKTLTGSTVKTISCGKKNTGVYSSYKFLCKLPRKTYKFYVYATDLAGNTQANVAYNKLVVK